MNAFPASNGGADLDTDKLNEQDKTELRQFLANEQQRAQIQSQTHNLTQLCWKKCITGSVKNAALDRSEEGCLKNCVDRFLDINMLTVKHLEKMRSS